MVLAHEQRCVRSELLIGSDGERPGLPCQLPECELLPVCFSSTPTGRLWLPTDSATAKPSNRGQKSETRHKWRTFLLLIIYLGHLLAAMEGGEKENKSFPWGTNGEAFRAGYPWWAAGFWWHGSYSALRIQRKISLIWQYFFFTFFSVFNSLLL